MKATNLDLRYDLVEDRLVLSAHGGGAEHVALLLTRRLTRALLDKLVEILMRSSAQTSQTPAEHRKEVFLFEHVSALSEPPAAGAPAADDAPAEAKAAVLPPLLAMVTRIDLAPIPAGFALTLFDASEPRVWVEATRSETHRLLDMLVRKSQEAGWGFDELNWLDRHRFVAAPVNRAGLA